MIERKGIATNRLERIVVMNRIEKVVVVVARP